jgi:hypothetical protein
MWWIKRLAVLWLALIALCGGAIALGRTDPTPDALQAAGFGVCDGEPCFKGIKLGDSREKVKAVLPEGLIEYLDIFSRDGTTVERIDIPLRNGKSLPKAHTFIAQFGIPCRIVWSGGEQMILIYPKMIFFVALIVGDGNDLNEFRLQLRSPVQQLWIYVDSDNGTFGTCNSKPDIYSGKWHGFTSVEVYQRHFLRESNMAGQ